MALMFKQVGAIELVADIQQYLKNELGRGADELREQSLVQAIAEPNKWMDQRTKDMNDLFKDGGVIQEAFNKAVAEYKSLNLPSEVVKAHALKRAQRAYEDALLIEEIKHPGLNQALGRYEAQRSAGRSTFTAPPQPQAQ